MVQVLGDDGRKRQRTFASLSEAKAGKRAMLRERELGIRPARRVTLRTYAREWIRSYTGATGRPIRPGTLAEYERDLELHVLPALGGLELDVITPAHVRDLARNLAAGKGPSPRGFVRRPLGLASVRNALAPLRALLRTAAVDGLILHNPTRDIRLAGPRLGDRKPRDLSDEDLGALLAHLPGLDHPEAAGGLMVRLLADTGMRPSEAAGLRWGDLELDGPRPMLRVRRRVLASGNVDEPKSSYGKRAIPLWPERADELTAWQRRCLLRGTASEDDYVFARLNGSPPSYDHVRRVVLDRAAEAAGIGHVTLYMLRHTRCTSLLRAGQRPEVVQRFMGHHDPGFTLAVYAHVRETDLPDLVDLRAAGRLAH